MMSESRPRRRCRLDFALHPSGFSVVDIILPRAPTGVYHARVRNGPCGLELVTEGTSCVYAWVRRLLMSSLTVAACGQGLAGAPFGGGPSRLWGVPSRPKNA